MSHSQSATRRELHLPEAPDRDEARLQGRWLTLARVGWVFTAVAILGMDAFGTPAALGIAKTACTSGRCQPPQLTPSQLHELAVSGMSPAFYGAYFVALNWLGTLVFTLIAAIIVARRSADRMALFAAFMLLLFGGAAAFGTMTALPDQNSFWWLPVNLAGIVGQVAFFVFFCVFPSGHFVPHWMRWVALLEAAYQMAAVVPLPPFQGLVSTSVLIAAFLAILICTQVYRYRRVSTPPERQQTKWVVLGFVVGFGVFIALLLYGNVALGPGARDEPRGTLVANTIFTVLICLVPISISIAILRSRLWDVDIIINRTLVYGSLTLILAAVYFGGVVGVQAVVQALTGQTKPQPVLIVASTLLIAALFTPLRRRLQTGIDRRFYRRKYDAVRTLATFGASLRSEVELGGLSQHLIVVVEDTMRPAHVSLWLNPLRREVAP
jgi:hypothetical protein